MGKGKWFLQRISLVFEFSIARIVYIPGFKGEGTCTIWNTEIRMQAKSAVETS